MKQVFFRRGKVVVEDVPPPAVAAGSVVVRTAFSCLSPGTELSGVRASGRPLWARALSEPDKVRKALEMLSTRGVTETARAVQERADAAHSTGYSASGTVVAVGEGVPDLRIGDAVACAGAQSAYHAELIRVPRNLCVPVPAGLALDSAATVTLGAIAMQGVRRAQPTLGETFAVIGLGLLGQLTVQLLRANGCRVIAMDIEPARIELARSLGADWGLPSGDTAVLETILRVTGGHGADGAIVTASGSSDDIVSLAFRLCRRKGRVVLVGDVGLDINRADIYEKELDFLVSSSYGPGRYDRSYEEEGLDYPIGYVRWTENRNMCEYLALLAAKRVTVEPLIAARFPLAQAFAAYASLGGGTRPLAALLEYPQGAAVSKTGDTRVAVSSAAAGGRLRLALIGAGSFLKSAHVPVLRSLDDRFTISAVMSRTGHKAKEVAQGAGAAYATTNFDEVLGDSGVDAVLIATRHDLHAGLALKALQAGKHVLVEKPLALKPQELQEIEAFFASKGDQAPLLLTGFNRRFSPYARMLRDLLAADGPAILAYRMNAGRLPADHWVFGPEGGGRNVGEACHIYDLFTYLTGARVQEVKASSASPRGGHYRADDNFGVLLSFDDGSCASLVYTAMGDTRAAKEQLDAYFGGKVARLDDYRRLECTSHSSALLETREPEKGLREELEAFHAAATGRSAWPIPLWQQVQASNIAFDVQRCLAGDAAG